MSWFSKFITAFKKKAASRSVSDKRLPDPEATVGQTVVRHEQDRSGEGLAEGERTALSSHSLEPNVSHVAEQKEEKRIKVWKEGDIILDRYEVEDVKEGGMGHVYIVEHKDWNVKMAIKSPKEMMLSDSSLFNRVLREADSWIKLGLHPHIAYCYYVRQIDDVPYIFIEYLDGGNLREWIGDMRCSDLKVALDLAVQFCHGIGYAHKHGMIHRDIKPENILMTKEGILKVTDFGIVRTQRVERNRPSTGTSHQNREPSDDQLTKASTIMGSADYISPEQWDDPQNVDARADIYSFGVCLYEMICGTRPYKSTSIEARKKRKKPYNALEHRPDIPPSLASLMRKSVALEREERLSSFEELRCELLKIHRELFHEDAPHAELNAPALRADGLNNRAVSYAELGKEKEAIELWTEALREDPQHLEATYNRGVALWRRGKLTDKDLVQQLRLVGSDETWLASYLLALIHLERGDVNSAMPLLEKVAKQAPEELEVQSALGLAQSYGVGACGCLRIFEVYADEVSPICLGADGSYALGARGSALRLWNMLSGEILRSFKGHMGEVRCVDLSSDSRYVLSGSADKTMRLWDVDTGKCLRVFGGHRGPVSSISMSGDARYAVSRSGPGNQGDAIQFWDLSTGNCLRTYWDSSAVLTSICLSCDGRYALSGSKDKTARLWEASTGRYLRAFEGHTDEVNSISLSADGHYALSGSTDKAMRLWDISTGRCLRIFQGHTGKVNSVCLSSDSRYALSGSGDKTMRLWEVSTGRCLHTFEGHTDELDSVNLSGDGRYALSRSKDGTSRLWRLPLGEPSVFPLRLSRSRSNAELTHFETQAGELLKRGEKALKDGRYADALALVRQARELPGHEYTQESMELWGKLARVCQRANLRVAWHAKTFTGHTHAVTSVSLSADGCYALSASKDMTLRFWDMTASRCLRTSDWVTSVSLSADGQYALSGGADNALQFWSMATGECLRTFQGHTGPVYSVSLGEDGRYALSGGRDSTLRLWDVDTGKCLRIYNGHVGPVYSVSLSADGQYALSGGFDKTMRFWDATTGQCLHAFQAHTDIVHSVDLSADGRYALSGSRDKTVRFWEVSTEQCLRIFAGHTDEVSSVSLSADSRHVLSGSKDGTLRLWDVATGECLQVFRGHKDGVTSVSLSADGRYALSGSGDGTLRLWKMDWELEAQPAAHDSITFPNAPPSDLSGTASRPDEMDQLDAKSACST
jgi:WD40 repeat protein